MLPRYVVWNDDSKVYFMNGPEVFDRPLGQVLFAKRG